MSEPFAGEKLLIKVIDDLAEFLPYLVLVGGWVPYIYAKYAWNNVPRLAVTTSDIDFGVGAKEYKGKESIASRVIRLRYGERHVSMDRLINIGRYFSAPDSEGPVLVEQENGPDEFIADLRRDIFERFDGLK